MQPNPKIQHLVEEHSVGFGRNSGLMQNNRESKKYELWEKSIFRQLATKIANFADIRQNNSVFRQKTCILKLSVMRNHEFY